ncbi:MAG: hypothetical protein CSB44_00315 [Gammaproteobacteria bacterium]|nr:MAG: hypothetical protein CSB44_00315 [Gammaproteobacteria bacterium]
MLFGHEEGEEERVLLSSEYEDEQGLLRLFRGKTDARGVTFVAPVHIPGLNVASGASVSHLGVRKVPVSVDYDYRDTVVENPSVIEFCLGYGVKDEVTPVPTDPDMYDLNVLLEEQVRECVMLSP